jgi:hypothetical protein
VKKAKNHPAAMAFLEALAGKCDPVESREVLRAMNFHPDEETFQRVDTCDGLPGFATTLAALNLITIVGHPPAERYQITSEGDRYLRTEGMTKMNRGAVDLAILNTLDEGKHSGQRQLSAHELLARVQKQLPDTDRDYLIARLESLQDDARVSVQWLSGGDEVIDFHARITSKGERHLAGDDVSGQGSTFVFHNSPVGAVIHQSQQVAIQNISQNLEELAKDNIDMAQLFQEFTDSITASAMPDENKKDALEAVADLSEEAAKPPDQRRQSRVRGGIAYLKDSLLAADMGVDLLHKVAQLFGAI